MTTPVFSRPERLRLVGLDFGSTTTSMLAATARVLSNCVTGRMELGDVSIEYRPESVFTPYIGEELDEAALAAQLDRWIGEARIEPGRLAAGGAIVTGLAARAANAATVARLVRERLGDALIATADDPSLESWLAFMGNTLALSQATPDTPFLNLDIGGGTTNLAWGQAGEVSRVGCYYIGARHVRFTPGGYRIAGLSSFGLRLLADLEIKKTIGEVLEQRELDFILDFYVGMLEAIIDGGPSAHTPAATFHTQAAFELPASDGRPIITLSGGVGQLAYARAHGERLPATTAFGDLGIDLALRICRSPLLSKDLQTHVPEGLGRATLYGLTIHNTEVSGTTIYLPRPGLLPLLDVPILGRLSDASTDGELQHLVRRASAAGRAAALSVELSSADWRVVKALGERLAAVIADELPQERPLVLFVNRNVGKTLGQYATRWGRLPHSLIVIDEIAVRDARFVRLGAPVQNVVPVTFYGIT